MKEHWMIAIVPRKDNVKLASTDLHLGYKDNNSALKETCMYIISENDYGMKFPTSWYRMDPIITKILMF